MDLAPGSTLIHPVHGISEVRAHEKREVAGETYDYVILAIPEQRLEVHVPKRELDEAGLRTAAPKAKAMEVLDMLGGEAERPHKTWRRALKRNKDRANSGKLRQVAVALRELSVKHRERGTLSPSERRLERKVTRMVVSEVAASLRLSVDKAQRRVDAALEDATFVTAA